MTALWVSLAVLAVLAWLPVGAELRYDGDAWVWLRLGPIRVQLLPKKAKKAKKPKKPKKAKAVSKKTRKKEASNSAEPSEKHSLGDTVAAAKPLIQVAVDALRKFRHLLLFRDLTVHVTVGAQNAAEAAIGYGRAWAAIGALTPMIDNVFHVRRRDYQAFVDYTEPKLRILLHAHLTLFLWQIISFAVTFGIRGLAAFLKFNNKRKGGATK